MLLAPAGCTLRADAVARLREALESRPGAAFAYGVSTRTDAGDVTLDGVFGWEPGRRRQGDLVDGPILAAPEALRAAERSPGGRADPRAVLVSSAVEAVHVRDVLQAGGAGPAAAERSILTAVSGPVLVCCAEALGDRPAGPALRTAGLARALAARGLPVTVVAPPGSRAPEGCELAELAELPGLVQGCRCAIASGFLLERHPVLGRAPALCADAAGPFLIENLWVHRDAALGLRSRVLRDEAAVAVRLLEMADLVLCAHERQRDLVLGMLLAAGAVDPAALDLDPGLERRVAVVPFGAPDGPAPERPPQRAPGPLRAVWPGGLWDWLDPAGAVAALAEARALGAEVELELWGTRSPDPLVPEPRAAAATREAAERLGVAAHVSLVEWVPYEERVGHLLAADIAITLDPGGLEQRFAFRTRLLDALWAGLPTLATHGEWMADLAAAQGAGWTVAPGDAAAAGRALAEAAADPARLAAMAAKCAGAGGDARLRRARRAAGRLAAPSPSARARSARRWARRVRRALRT